ncbi:MAG: hypothetical protein ACR2ND_09950 [Solirubrobacteraceae bacterium]
MVRRSAIPYGYTLTIWTSGAAIEHSHGTPTVGDTFLFLIGAVAGFAVLGSLSQFTDETPLRPKTEDLIRTGLTQGVAVGLALGAAALVALLHSFAAWALGGFAATLIYLAVVAMVLAVSSRESSGMPRP